MSTNFGFTPVSDGEYYFVSYNTEDSDRVGAIAHALNNSNIALWYDIGLEYGEEWKKQIAVQIHHSKAVIMFITLGVLEKENSYVRMESKIAKLYKVPIIPVILDDIDSAAVPDHSASWWIDTIELQTVPYDADADENDLCDEIIYALNHLKPSKPTRQKTPPKPPKPTKTPPSADPADLSESVPDKPAVDKEDVPVETTPASCPPASRRTPPVAPSPAPATVPRRTGVQVGSCIMLGSYPQNDSTPEPVEWLVLAVESDRALVISKYALDHVMFNSEGTSGWDTCTLRSWLNNEFFSQVFTPDEQQQILTVSINTPDNNVSHASGCGQTDDRIFCLSIDQAADLFANDRDRSTSSTRYAEEHGAFKGTCWWWLRSPGSSEMSAVVYEDGKINAYGQEVYNKQSVRPAFYISL